MDVGHQSALLKKPGWFKKYRSYLPQPVAD